MMTRLVASGVIALLYLTTLCSATKKLIMDTDIFADVE